MSVLRTRWIVRWVALLTLPAAAILVALPRRGQRTDTPEALIVTDSSASLHAFLVVRPSDCAGQLGFLHVFERPGTGTMRFDGLLITGMDDASMTVQALLAELDLPFVQAIPVQANVFRQYSNSFPMLAIYDRHRTLRMLLQAPSTAERAERLVSWIDVLNR
ncbi:MAG TPA: hypothetical protein VFT29_18105 [Gemmatimonadaceae bacterium]|nr:hypothetical protein [Gemmatimonadaceae bacterium]